MFFLQKLALLIAAPLLFATPKKSKVGGQAVLEGIMMRAKMKISLTVRKPNGELITEVIPFISAARKNKTLKFPIIRGAVNLYESLLIGYKTLSRSAEILEAAEQEKNNSSKSKEPSSLGSWLSLGFALIISLGIFMYLPMWILSQFIPKDSALLFNSAAGALRIIFFLGYIILISFWKEIRRVFEYHGAEHKAIYAFEDNKELTFENMQSYTTLHPRCGTSFLLLAALTSMILFTIGDAILITLFGPYPSVAARFIIHLILIPLVGGMSYEILKLSDKYSHFSIIGMLIKPGLWLQLITTRSPDNKQLEVASTALKAAI